MENIGSLQEDRLRAVVEAMVLATKAANSNSNDLLAEDSSVGIYLEVGLAKVPAAVCSKSPITFTIPHGVHQRAEACLVASPHMAEELKDHFQENPIPQLKKVIGKQKVWSNYKTFGEKSLFRGSYDVFFCDSREEFEMNGILSRTNCSSNRTPVPIGNLEEDLAACEETMQALLRHGTWIKPITSNIVTVLIGKTDMSVESIIDNAQSLALQLEAYLTSIKNCALMVRLLIDNYPPVMVWRHGRYWRHITRRKRKFDTAGTGGRADVKLIRKGSAEDPASDTAEDPASDTAEDPASD
eukprot:Filipodium_phascolosomae@DN7785_c0_g1_i1.p1